MSLKFRVDWRKMTREIRIRCDKCEQDITQARHYELKLIEYYGSYNYTSTVLPIISAPKHLCISCYNDEFPKKED